MSNTQIFFTVLIGILLVYVLFGVLVKFIKIILTVLLVGAVVGAIAFFAITRDWSSSSKKENTENTSSGSKTYGQKKYTITYKTVLQRKTFRFSEQPDGRVKVWLSCKICCWKDYPKGGKIALEYENGKLIGYDSPGEEGGWGSITSGYYYFRPVDKSAWGVEIHWCDELEEIHWATK